MPPFPVYVSFFKLSLYPGVARVADCQLREPGPVDGLLIFLASSLFLKGSLSSQGFSLESCISKVGSSDAIQFQQPLGWFRFQATFSSFPNIQYQGSLALCLQQYCNPTIAHGGCKNSTKNVLKNKEKKKSVQICHSLLKVRHTKTIYLDQ